MNETGNWTEEDASWINFRLTIQQVVYLSLDPRALILNENHDIAIAMSSSRADPVMG